MALKPDDTAMMFFFRWALFRSLLFANHSVVNKGSMFFFYQQRISVATGFLSSQGAKPGPTCLMS